MLGFAGVGAVAVGAVAGGANLLGDRLGALEIGLAGRCLRRGGRRHQRAGERRQQQNASHRVTPRRQRRASGGDSGFLRPRNADPMVQKRRIVTESREPGQSRPRARDRPGRRRGEASAAAGRIPAQLSPTTSSCRRRARRKSRSPGRSNAGKSSAINALANRTRLAFTSKTPGRTQQINFFRLRGGALLADLPGYGYAAVPQRAEAPLAGVPRALPRDAPVAGRARAGRRRAARARRSRSQPARGLSDERPAGASACDQDGQVRGVGAARGAARDRARCRRGVSACMRRR